MNEAEKKDWERITRSMREDCLKMAQASGKNGMHFGGTFSMIEIAAALYIGIGNTFGNDERNRIIVSKGHGIPAVYAVLKQIGRVTDTEIQTFKGEETELYAHPSMNARLGVEFSSGSLGQGLSLGVGCALAMRHKGVEKNKVYVILGDGECNEGSVWEAALSASKYQLNRLCAIIDRNHIQYDGDTGEVLPLEPLREKWSSFGWDTLEIDGHDVEACRKAFLAETDKPLVVIANTVKGKGISFMENQSGWHFGQLTSRQFEQAWGEVADDRVFL